MSDVGGTLTKEDAYEILPHNVVYDILYMHYKVCAADVAR